MFRVISLCLLVTVLFCSCTSENAVSVDNHVIFTGDIHNMDSGTLYYSSSFERNQLETEHGEFQLEIEPGIPLTMVFFTQSISWSCFAKPGDSIHVSFDNESFDSTLVFTGDRSVENAFLQEYDRTLKEKQGKSADYYSLEESEFIAKAKAIEKEQNELLDNFKSQNPGTDAQFINFVAADIKLSSAMAFDRYEYNYKRYTEDTTYVESESIKAAKEEIVVENLELLGLSKYTNYLNSIMYDKFEEIEESNPDLAEEDNFVGIGMIAIEGFENPKIKEYLSFSILNNWAGYEGPDKNQEHFAAFLENTTNDIYTSQIIAQLKEWDHLRVGMQAPEFQYPDIDSVLHSLGDFKGKYVHIDVWATWCKPCLAEQPALEELEAHYKDNPNIAFVGVSVDDDKAAWEKMVREKELQGVQLIAENGWQSKISEDYKVNGIPRFILVGTKGELIDASAKRPSSEAFKAQLKNLLEPTPVVGG